MYSKQRYIDSKFWKNKNKYYHKYISRVYGSIIPRGSSVCHIGCGNGDLLNSFGCSIKTGIGIDSIEEAIHDAVKINSSSWTYYKCCDDYKTLENLYNYFDYVILSDILCDLDDVQKTLENLSSFCNKRTRLIINSHNYLWQPIFKLAQKLGLRQKLPEQNWLSVKDIENLLNLADYEVVRKEGYILIPIYIPLISSFVNSVIAKLPIIRHFTLSQFIIARYMPKNFCNVDYSVSIIVPAKNERGNIEPLIQRTPKFGKSQEFIFIEGGSTDGTWGEIEKTRQKYYNSKQIRLYQQKKKGKYDAVKTGLFYATGEIVMILDADLTMPPEELPKFYEALKNNKGEFANGVRLIYPMENKSMRFLNLIANKLFGIMFSYILGETYKDTLCGTKVLWRKEFESIVYNDRYWLGLDPYGDFNIIFGAHKENLKSVQIPIRYKQRQYGTTQISRFSGGWLLLKMTLVGLYKIKWKLL